MKQIEKVLKVLANLRRLRILYLLQIQGEQTVSEIAGYLSLSLPATSRHLNRLKNVDILETRQESLEVFYRISKDPPLPTRLILSTF